MIRGRSLKVVNKNGVRALLKKLQWESGGPSRSDYELYLREHGVLGEAETLSDYPALSVQVYRDWQRRPQVACMFARKIAVQPKRYGVETKVVTDDPAVAMTAVVNETAEAIDSVCGTQDAITVLVPKLTNSRLLVAFCKRLGARNGRWRIDASLNPSDHLQRVYVGLRYKLEEKVESEILGFGPFNFLPITRRSPIAVLEVRTKTGGSKPRGGSYIKRSHLADMPWPNSDRSRNKDWGLSTDARRAVLGGDDSAARARITFAIPRSLWDGHDG